MPIYDLNRFVEQRYGKRIEAPNEKAALKVAQEMTDDQWGDVEGTTSDSIVVFTEQGDEVARDGD